MQPGKISCSALVGRLDDPHQGPAHISGLSAADCGTAFPSAGPAADKGMHTLMQAAGARTDHGRQVDVGSESLTAQPHMLSDVHEAIGMRYAAMTHTSTLECNTMPAKYITCLVCTPAHSQSSPGASGKGARCQGRGGCRSNWATRTSANQEAPTRLLPHAGSTTRTSAAGRK